MNQWIAHYEGQQLLLYRDPSNPYEDIRISIQVDGGCMYLGDEEYAYGPDGGHSMKIFTFDQENTEKVFDLLSEDGSDPVMVLKHMLGYPHRTRKFISLCEEKGIQFTGELYL